MDDPFRHFVLAQQPLHADVEAELAAGRKTTHWMWFVFPQLAGLGHSPMAQRYALRSLADAAAYLAHPVLGPRLRHCTALVNRHRDRSVGEIFGSPDDLKFHSSMTLFDHATTDNAEFRAALEAFFAGREDVRTLELLGGPDARADAAVAARLDALEIRIAYQDQTIEELNTALARQWQEIDRLRRDMAGLEAELRQAAPGGPEAPEPPPPHY